MKDEGKDRTIGALAAASGVNVETVRYYQRRGCCVSHASRRAGFVAMRKMTWRGFDSSKSRNGSVSHWMKSLRY